MNAVIALFAGAFFGDASWVGTLMYFMGIVLIFLGALLVNLISPVFELPAVKTMSNYLLPALFGALYIQFAMKNAKLAVIMTVFGVIVNYLISAGVFNFIPGASNYLGTLLCVFGSIFIGLMLNKKKA